MEESILSIITNKLKYNHLDKKYIFKKTRYKKKLQMEIRIDYFLVIIGWILLLEK